MSTAPLRILMVTPRSPLAAGGVERYVWEVSSRLRDRGLHVEVLCADPGGHSPRWQEREGIVIRSARAWPAERDWCFAPGMWREMEAETWDVIHVQSYHTLVAPLAMLRALTTRTPYVVTFHGGGSSSVWRNRARAVQRQVLRPLLARASVLIALAQFEIDLYSRSLGVPRERFRLIPVGTDLKLSADAAGDGDGTGAVLASIGRLERYKGHQRVIAALPYLLESCPEARLLIVGKGPYEAALRRCAAELGVGEHVEFTSVKPGDMNGMAEMLSHVSLVVLMSEYETHPQVALEAAAVRRRLLVADDHAGLRELAQNGLARTIALGTPPSTLAAAISEELTKPPPTVRPRLTSWDECVDQLASVYRAVARS